VPRAHGRHRRHSRLVPERRVGTPAQRAVVEVLRGAVGATRILGVLDAGTTVDRLAFDGRNNRRQRCLKQREHRKKDAHRRAPRGHDMEDMPA